MIALMHERIFFENHIDFSRTGNSEKNIALREIVTSWRIVTVNHPILRNGFVCV